VEVDEKPPGACFRVGARSGWSTQRGGGLVDKKRPKSLHLEGDNSLRGASEWERPDNTGIE